jgi:HEPN domain-containing protein
MLHNNEEKGRPQEWLNRAYGDLNIAKNYHPGYYYEDLCFHCQQAVEKAIKAVLIYNNIPLIKTHDIQVLLALLPTKLSAPITAEESAMISEYAVSTRYPGDYEPTTEEDWMKVISVTEAIISWSKKLLEL